MKFLNLDLAKTFNAPEFTGSDPVARATWFCLACYSAIQENGGRIPNCKGWGERRWPQEAKVFRSEIDLTVKTGLIAWENTDLVVWGYPADQEAAILAKRSGGRAGGKAFADMMKAKAKGPNGSSPDTVSGHSPEHSPGASPDGREGNGMEGNVISKGRSSKITISDYPAIHDPRHDALDLASSLTGDWTERGRGYWAQSLTILGQEAFRRDLETVFGEKKAGEHGKNWAAILTTRLKASRLAKATPPGQKQA